MVTSVEKALRRREIKNDRILIILALLLLTGGTGLALPNDEDVKIETVQDGDRFYVHGENLNPYAPFHVTIGFSRLDNMTSSIPMPGRFVLKPGAKRQLFTVTASDPRKASSFALQTEYGMGDPDAVPDAGHAWSLPFEHGTKHTIMQGYMGRETHQGLYALDFDLDDGVPVCAAREGIVVAVRDDSNIGGPGPQFEDYSNYVRILHPDGTLSSYGHLKYHGVLVAMGETVTANQRIGLSGNTGSSSGAHLHFAVSRFSWSAQAQTIPVKFLQRDGQTVSPQEGKTYYAYAPGAPPFAEILGADVTDADLKDSVEDTPLNGRVELVKKKVDEKVVLFIANGMAGDQRVTLDVVELTNMSVSQAVPLTRVVPAGKKVFFLILTRVTMDRASYKTKFSWQAVRPSGRKPK